MKSIVVLSLGAMALVLAMACTNETGLSRAPRATFSQIACLDVNGDSAVNAADAANPDDVPDFNADNDHDEQDTAFLQGVNIPIDPNFDRSACEDDDDTPEYAVPHGFFSDANVRCGEGEAPVLLLGIGGGDVNIREKEDAAGIRSVVDALQDAYADRDVRTRPILAGPAVHAAQAPHTAMEDWLTHAMQVYLDRYPCLRIAIIGHSHGATTGDVVAARLEDQYRDRFVAVVDVDRVEELYTGDTASRPDVAPVFNIFERNDPTWPGDPYNMPNAENWDATAELGPSDGEEGGEPQPVTHTTIDNSEPVRERIVAEVMERS